MFGGVDFPQLINTTEMTYSAYMACIEAIRILDPAKVAISKMQEFFF